MLTPLHLESEVPLSVSYARAYICIPQVHDPHKCLQFIIISYFFSLSDF